MIMMMQTRVDGMMMMETRVDVIMVMIRSC